jgi:hypothetical protein
MLGHAVSSVFDSALRTAGGKEREVRGGAGAGVELRFEWVRGVKKERKRKDGAPPPTKELGASSAAPSTTSLASQGRATASAPGSRIIASRRSTENSRARSTSPTRRSETRSVRSTEDGHEIDDGDESDPEDSETPWTCTLIGHSAEGMPESGQEPIRVKVASLSPTPHHPKVVAALKIPFPLPDVDVDGLVLRPRVITPAGIARPALEHSESGGSTGPAGGSGTGPRRGREAGLMLTAEEIKDIVSTTGMWLVVREGIGGVGRVSRKGDGWKIRG